MSYLKEQIERLRARELGPADPRTPSIMSSLSGELSFENRRKILEMQQLTLRDIDYEREQSEEQAHIFWSDPVRLKTKLDSTVRAVAAVGGINPERIFSVFAIVEGSGEVVMKLDDDRYHYVEINLSNLPVYISPEATLPEEKIPLLKTGKDFNMT